MHKEILKDGLRVIAVPHKGTQTVSVLVMVNVGSRYEPEKIAGISHFLEHIVFKGTSKRPSTIDISSAIDRVGGQINAFTGKEFTGFWAKVAVHQFDTALDVISDLVQHPKLRPADIEKEKGVIIEEINMYEDTPRDHIHDIFEQVLFPGNPLGRDTAGKKESVRRITKADFEDYLAKHYVADNVVVTVAGNFDSDKVISKIDKAFNFRSKKADKNFTAVSGVQTQPAATIINKKTEQTHLALGVRGYDNNHPDKYVSKLLAVILAGSMSSRLFREIREKRGLAYYVRGFSHSYRDAGYLMVQAGIEKSKLAEVISIVVHELKKIRDKGLVAGELVKAKEYFKGNLIIDLEDSASLAEFYAAKTLMNDKTNTVEAVLAKIDNITSEDMARVATDLFKTRNLNLAVIGDVKGEERLRNLLKI